MNAPETKKRATGLAADAIALKHLTGPGHPESPARFTAVMEAIEKAGLIDTLKRIQPEPIDLDTVALCHAREYIKTAQSNIENGFLELQTGDTVVCADSMKVARMAVGALTGAVDAVYAGTVDNAFCVVRPPGHHATPRAGMGFCIFNNVAVAARHAQKKHGAKHVLIVDWDVHHGNGTQDIFYEDGTVFYFSIHQSPWYPGTGARHETGRGEGKGTTLNCPMAAGSGRREILEAFEKELVPAMKTFKPDLVLISAGFDSRVGDPLGGLKLTDEDFKDLTRILLDIADTYAEGRTVSALEGGYNLSGLASAATAHLQVLMGA